MKKNSTVRATMNVLVSAIALVSVSACVPSEAQYSGAASEKRNEVRMVRLTHTVEVYDKRYLSAEAIAGLDRFISENRVGYGDTLSLDAGDEAAGEKGRKVIRSLLLKRGLRLDPNPTIAGALPADGTVVLVVDRYVVTTPNCSDWSMKSKPNYANAPSPNFGCTTRALLGQMVANPRDLIQGEEYTGPESSAATNAVETYLNRAGTGSGGSN